jgi:hypothetical protein
VYLDIDMLYVAMILCLMFRKKIPTYLSVEWVVIINEVDKGYTFNWAKILLDNLAKEIVDYKTTKSKGIFPIFTCQHMLWMSSIS